MASSAILVVVGYPIMTNAIALISPTSLRIGPDKHRYDYTVIPGFSLLGGLFTGAAVAAILAPRRCIFIESLGVLVSEGFQHEVTDVMDIERGGEPAFRAVGAVVIDEDWHE